MALCKSLFVYSADSRFMARFRWYFIPSYRIEWQCENLIYLKVKMSLITQAYFEEGDFSNVSLIKVS